LVVLEVVVFAIDLLAMSRGVEMCIVDPISVLKYISHRG